MDLFFILGTQLLGRRLNFLLGLGRFCGLEVGPELLDRFLQLFAAGRQVVPLLEQFLVAELGDRIGGFTGWLFAGLRGMRFLPPLLLHGAHKVSDEQLRAHADVYAERLASYPAWPEIEELPECAQCEVPLTARPLENYAETT